jgi:hypothetical protein
MSDDILELVDLVDQVQETLRRNDLKPSSPPASDAPADAEPPQQSQADGTFSRDFTAAHLLAKLVEIARDEATPLPPEAFADGRLGETISNLRGAVKQRVERATPPLIDRGTREALADADIEQLFEQALSDTVRELSHGSLGGAEAHETPVPAEGRTRESQATAIVRLVLEASADLFHDGENCYATFAVGNHLETHPLRSRVMRRWLTHLYFECQQKAPSVEAVKSAIETLAGHALFEGAERKTYIRVASSGNSLYLDLCNLEWQIAEIDPAGWRIIESRACPTLFRRAHGMKALPVPERGDNINQLRNYINVAPDDDLKLVTAWLLSCYRATGPYPILILHGEQGTAKTTTTRVLRELLDPSTAPVRSEPHDARDLMIAANNGWILCYDNLSHLDPWLSDALCRLATGGGFSTRELYTDADEVIFDAQRPALLNGIEELAHRGDLLDRAIIIYLPRIQENQRLTEEEFYRHFHEARPRILGALLDTVSAALRNYDSIRLDKLPRMADFARWATAAETALGWDSGSFMKAYTANRNAGNYLALEASPITSPLSEVGDFEGTATELLVRLNAAVDEKILSLKTWPKSARSLSNALRRIAPNLVAVGTTIAFEKPSRKTAGRRLIVIAAQPATSVEPSSPPFPPSPNAQNQRVVGDDRGDDRNGGLALATPPSVPKSPVTATRAVDGDGGDGEIQPPAPDFEDVEP